jgi:AAA domain/Bifunctional DNA primase/polymerase, N-terminal
MYPTENPRNSQLSSNGVLAHRAVNHALSLAREGFRVIPLGDPTSETPKSPFMKNWPNVATNNKKQIRKWWSEHPDANVGWVMGLQPNGRYLVALDIDMKDGKNGEKSLARYELLDLKTDGRQTLTPSNGRHLVFWTTRDFKNSVEIADGIDIRSGGGQIVAPGSIFEGKAYVKLDGEIPELPEWMAGIIDAAGGATRAKRKDAATPLVELDQPHQIAAATKWLTEEAPEAVEGNRGDSTTFKVCATVKDFGISEPEGLSLIWENWNETKAIPSWDMDDLRRINSSAHRNGQLPAGIKDPKGEFGDADVSCLETGIETTPKPKRGLYYLGLKAGAEQAIRAMGRPLVKGLLDCGAFSLLFGPTNSGKTFVMLDIAFHIAAGRPWQGRKVKQGLVIYVAAEGGRGILKRLFALRKHYGVDDVPLVVVPCPVNLLDKTQAGDTSKLIALVRQAEVEYGQPAELVVIDALSRSLAGGNENAPDDMGTFVGHVDRVRAALKSHLTVVHHTGLTETHRARGSTVLPAAVDTEIRVLDGEISTTKQRDREKIKPLRFKLKNIPVGVDEDGDPVSSCVIEVFAAPEFDVGLTPSEAETLERLRELGRLTTDARDKAKHPKAPDEVIFKTGALVDYLQTRSDDEQTSALNRTTINNTLIALGDKRAIKKLKHGQWVLANVWDV